MVIAFEDEQTAFALRAELAKMQAEYLIDMEDVVVVTKDDKGNVKLHQAQNLTALGAVSGSSWPLLVYAVLSLTLIRMLPVYLSLRGLPLRPNAKLLVGWFGPRGLASIVFAIIVLNANLPGGGTLALTVVCTIVLSVLLHSLTANPLVAAFGRASRREGKVR